MAGIKRYHLDVDVHNTRAYGFEAPEGEWCKFADILPIVQEAFAHGRKHEKFLQTQPYLNKEEPNAATST